MIIDYLYWLTALVPMHTGLRVTAGVTNLDISCPKQSYQAAAG